MGQTGPLNPTALMGMVKGKSMRRKTFVEIIIVSMARPTGREVPDATSPRPCPIGRAVPVGDVFKTFAAQGNILFHGKEVFEMRKSKVVLTVLFLGAMSLSGLYGASPAEAGVKLDDIQISARWRGDHRPPPPGPRWHRRHGPGGPRHFHGHGPMGFHGPHGPRGPHGPWRDGPPPPLPPHHRRHHHRDRW